METYDVIVIGCGPAGLSAAINLHIRNKKLKIFGVEMCSPKLQSAPWVDNYLGLQVSGPELRDRYLAHISSLGLSIHKSRADTIVPLGDKYLVAAKGEMYEAQAIVLATGINQASYLPGERDFVGKGVSYCGTCDGPLYRGKTVAVVAYTPEGIEEANYLHSVAGKVYFVPQIKEYEELNPEIEVVHDKPIGILGETTLTHLALKNSRIEADGVFIFRDVTPAEQLITGLSMVRGVIEVDRSMATNLPGVFAAGDCTGKPFQVAKAVGEGAIAGLSAASYVDRLRNIRPSS